MCVTLLMLESDVLHVHINMGLGLGVDCLAADVMVWLQQEKIEERLQAVPARVAAQNEPLYGPGIKVDHEDVLYIALHNAVYSVVNEAARHLGYALLYCKARGKLSSTVHGKVVALELSWCYMYYGLAPELQREDCISYLLLLYNASTYCLL